MADFCGWRRAISEGVSVYWPCPFFFRSNGWEPRRALPIKCGKVRMCKRVAAYSTLARAPARVRLMSQLTH